MKTTKKLFSLKIGTAYCLFLNNFHNGNLPLNISHEIIIHQMPGIHICLYVMLMKVIYLDKVFIKLYILDYTSFY